MTLQEICIEVKAFMEAYYLKRDNIKANISGGLWWLDNYQMEGGDEKQATDEFIEALSTSLYWHFIQGIKRVDSKEIFKECQVFLNAYNWDKGNIKWKIKVVLRGIDDNSLTDILYGDERNSTSELLEILTVALYWHAIREAKK